MATTPARHARLAAALSILAVLAPACGGTDGADAPAQPPVADPGGSDPTQDRMPPTVPTTPPPSSTIWGVTVDDPWNVEPTVDALARLPRRPLARIVFDEGQPARAYAPVVASIHEVSDVMGELLDSFYVPTVGVPEYVDRAKEYLDTLGTTVDVWEVGNEVNGEWLGASSDVVAKVKGAYDLVKARGRPAALTLYYNEGCWESRDHEMFTWVSANVPASMRAGLDFVWVSYYEDDCNGLQPDWPAVFERLARIFPNAKLGIGECGTTRSAAKSSYLARYYTLDVPEPRFVGGYFWWYFSSDMVPASRPLWQELHDLILAGG